MGDFSSDINPPPKFTDEDELPSGYVGATTMPGPVIFNKDKEESGLEPVKEKDSSKGDQTKSGTCVEMEKDIPGDQGKIKEYKKPSYLHGVVGSLKDTVGKYMGSEETEVEGKRQKESEKREIKHSDVY